MKNVNIVCTSKPGDGLLHYSFEHCCFLNDLGINAKLIIVRHHKFTSQDYLNALNECYKKVENIIFDYYMIDYIISNIDILLALIAVIIFYKRLIRHGRSSIPSV